MDFRVVVDESGVVKALLDDRRACSKAARRSRRIMVRRCVSHSDSVNYLTCSFLTILPRLLDLARPSLFRARQHVDHDQNYWHSTTYNEAQNNRHIMTSSTYSTGSKWERTNLRLAASSNSASGFSTGTDNADSKDADDYLCLPTSLDSSSTMAVDDPNNNNDNHDDAQHQRSRSRQLQHLFELDLYLSSVPQLAASTRQLLQSSSSSTNSTANNHHNNNSNHHKVITSSNSGRVINVLQGEMAHCTPTQADVLVSDDATTCHILGLWSHLSSLDYSSNTAQRHDQMQQPNGGDSKLATVAHIDSPDYEDCIRDAVDLHYRYHSSQLSSSSSSSAKQQHTRLNGDDSAILLPVIELSIHLMGGYNDSDGTSHEITQGVLRALSNISNDYINRQRQQQPRLQMILQTCAVSSSNDNGRGCPIGRGLALDVSSGKVYLAEVSGEDDVESSSSSSLLLDNSTTVVTTSTSAKGPDCILRQARLWASFIFNNGENDSNDDDDNKRRLQVIHHPNDEYLYISPFYFASHPFPHRMLALNDALLLQYTSSSPEVEKDNFVRCVRETFRYMNGTSCFHVFKKKKVMNEDDDDDEKNYGLDDWWDDEDYLPRRYRRVGLNGWAAVA
eukprot:scaffold16212_cov102-Skeletonema_dohrnii-CCMP3373.AAC.3